VVLRLVPVVVQQLLSVQIQKGTTALTIQRHHQLERPPVVRISMHGVLAQNLLHLLQDVLRLLVELVVQVILPIQIITDAIGVVA
jgi:hypothetical protein